MPHRRLPPLSSLRAFEAAARRGSFKHAAEELGVTPAAVSQQVRGLEEDLGLSLFTRGARSVTLTVPGNTLRSGLVEAFVKIHEAVEQARALSDPGLVVTSSGPVAAKWLVPRLNTFSAQYPEVAVHLQASFDMISLGGGGSDVAIRFGRKPDNDVYHERLWDEMVLPLASPDLVERLDLKSPADIQRAPLIHDESLTSLFPGAPDWSQWFEAAGLTGLNSQRGMRFTNYADQAIDAAISGSGVLLGRVGLAGGDLQAGRLVCPFGPIYPTDYSYYFVCPKGAETTSCVEKFLIWIRNQNVEWNALLEQLDQDLVHA